MTPPAPPAAARRPWKKRLKTFRRSLRDPLLHAAAGTVASLAGILPRATLSPLAAITAALMGLWPPARRQALANLAIAFPELNPAARRRLAASSRRNLILTFLEFLWFSRHPEQLKPAVDTANPEAQAILAACRAGRGTLFFTPHLGNWELGGQILAAQGVALHVIYARIRNPQLEKLVLSARRHHGMIPIPEDGAVRGMLQAFRAGHPVGILMDQTTPPRKGGVFVPFFGLPAAVTRAPASLARRLNLQLVLGALVRENGRLSLRGQPLPRPASDYASDEELTADLMAAHAALIRRYPDQYLWMYDRWRHIPPGADPAPFPAYARPLE